MVKLQLFHEDVIENSINIPVYNFETIYKINIIGGDSGTGKTLFMSNLLKALIAEDGWSLECNKKVIVINSVLSFKEQIKENKEAVFICDEDVTQSLLKNNLADMVSKSKNYFILLDRGINAFIDTNVKSLFCMKGTGRIYEGIEIYDIQVCFKMNPVKSVINRYEYGTLVCEDTESGKIFWTKMLDYIKLYEGPGGKSNVPINLKKALKDTTKKVLIAMDYDSCLVEMVNIMRDDTIDKSRITFISMESFEEVLCNSEFILNKFPEMRDKVINYQEYVDASYKHTGKYFSDLLFRYVKVKSPLKEHGEKNVTKFYAKGMKNFEACFLNNCCVYGMEECKLFTDEEKKKLMLCNKFELLREFSSSFD